jgi:hypothetical protein
LLPPLPRLLSFFISLVRTTSGVLSVAVLFKGVLFVAAAVVRVLPRFSFDLAAFEDGHGRLPRGVGCWAFAFLVAGATRIVVSPPLRFAAAKSWAVDAAVAAGAAAGSVLFLLP